MNHILYLDYVNIFIILFSLLCCIYRYRALDHASKIFAILVCTSALSEFIGYFFATKYHNNLPVYAVNSLLEFGIICLYFNNIIDLFIRNNIGIYIGGVGILWGVTNIVFLQGLNKVNSYFLVFEGLCIIGMCLFAYVRLLLHHDQLRLYKYPHFWFITILMIYWSMIFLTWSLYNYVCVRYKEAGWIVSLSIVIVNMLNYISLGCVFILYPKMQKNE